MSGFFSHLSIRTKLVAAFAVVLCGTVGLGLFAVQRLDGVNAAAADIRDNWLPATRALGEMGRLAEQIRINQMLQADTGTTEDRAIYTDSVTTKTKQFEQTLQAYDSTVAMDAPDILLEETALAATLKTSWTAYQAMSVKYQSLLDHGSHEETMTFSFHDMRAGMETFRQALSADLDFQIREANRAGERGTALGNSAHRLIIIVLGAIAMLCIGMGWWLNGDISAPITSMTAAMRRLADRDLSSDVPGTGRGDEIGSMAAAVLVFKDNMIKGDRQEAEAVSVRNSADQERRRHEKERANEAAEDAIAIQALARGLHALAAGNLTHEVTEDVAPKTLQLKDDFNVTASRLRETMATIAGAIEGMSNGTGEISQAADDLSKRTEQQAASLEQTAAALDQITTTVRKTADGAIHVQDVVSSAKKDAEYSSGVVRDAVLAMGEIEKSSQQVSQIIGVIDEIAFQTNLLALNAGVEAARAGDAGRGFAVVASEVRALAQRSAQAAKEIKQLISMSSKQVGHGVKLVDETGLSLRRIVEHVAEVYIAVTEIAASAKEQATALHEVNTAINQMDQVTQQNAAMVEESTAASHSLAQETRELARLAAGFQLGPKTNTVPMPAKATQSRRTAEAPARSARAPMLKVVGQDRRPEPATADGWEEF